MFIKKRLPILIGTLLLAILSLCALYLYQDRNTFFFKKGITEVKYEGYIYPLSCEEIWENVTLKVSKIGTFENGELFTLELAQLDVADADDRITMGRQYLGYFYVKDTQIFRMLVKDYTGFSEEQTRDILKLIQEDEKKFLDMCYIVCSDEEVFDTVDINGYHSGVISQGEKRIYYYYNEEGSGTKDYEKIIWERGKGIIYYMRGSGAMLMHIEFGVDLSKSISNKSLIN